MEFIKTAVENIDLNIIKTSKFKTTRIQVSFVGDVVEKELTARALVPYLLKTVSNKYQEEQELQKHLEELYSATLNVGINKISKAHTITFDLSVIDNVYTIDHEDLMDEAFSFLHEIIFQPYFKEDVFQNEKRLLLEYFQGIYANKMKYSVKQLVKSMFKDETFRLDQLGNQEALEKLTLNDVKEAYNNLIKNDLMFITVVGNVDAEEIKSYIKTYFTSNNVTRIPVLLSDEDKEISAINTIKEEQDVQQAKLVCGYRFDVKYREKDYYAATIFNLLLGGSTESLLFQEIREKLGLVYFINSSYNPYKGALFIYSGINQDDYQKVLTETETLIERIQQGDFKDELIDIMKKLFKNGMIQGMDSNHALAGKISQSYLFNFEYSIQDTLDHLERVTKQDVMEVARKLRKDTIYLLRGALDE